MGVSTETGIKYGYAHANSKSLTELSQSVYESQLKSSHVVSATEILYDSIDYCPTPSDADLFVLNNPSILKKYVQYSLTPIPGTNFQSWYIHDNDLNKWMKPFVTADMVTDETNATSNGFRFLLFRQDLYPIGPTSGSWWIDPYQAIVHFEEGYTPNDLGYGIPKVTCYVYTGRYLDSYLTDAKPLNYFFTSDYPSIRHTIQHDLDTYNLNITVVVQDPLTLEWTNDLVKMQFLDEHTLQIDLSSSSNIRVSVSSIR